MKIKTNDTVQVISGKDRGRQGKVLATYPSEQKVLVEGINMADRHTKPTRQGEEGGIIRKAIPIRASKVMVVCPKCGHVTRVGYKVLEDGTKIRYCSGRNGCGETF